MSGKYEVEITINNVTNSGYMQISRDRLKLMISNKVKDILYTEIKIVSKESNNKLIIELKNNIIMYVSSENVELFFDYINQHIKNKKNIFNSLNQRIANNYGAMIICSIFGLIVLGAVYQLVRKYIPIFSEIIRFFLVIVALVLLAILVYAIISSIKKSLDFINDLSNNENRRNFYLYKISLVCVPIIFFAIILIYHNTGARGAVNDCYNSFKFVSCEKNTVLGNEVYTCYRGGKKSIVSCNDKNCEAVCER